MQSVLKTITFYLLVGLPFAKYSGVSSQLYTDETTLSGPNVCKRIEEYVLYNNNNNNYDKQ